MQCTLYTVQLHYIIQSSGRSGQQNRIQTIRTINGFGQKTGSGQQNQDLDKKQYPDIKPESEKTGSGHKKSDPVRFQPL